MNFPIPKIKHHARRVYNDLLLCFYFPPPTLLALALGPSAPHTALSAALFIP